MKVKRLAAVALAAIVACCSAALMSVSAKISTGVDGDIVSDWISYNTEHIEGTRRIAAVTGKYATTDTEALFDVGGTDLGIPCAYTYTDAEGNEKTELRILFGDTFSTSKLQGNWRSNVMAISTDFDYSDGISIDSFVSSLPDGKATEIVHGVHVNQQQMTAIPTGCVQIGNALYVYYMGIRVWGDDGEWWNNVGGVYKSTDGQNFARVESMCIYSNKMASFTQNCPMLADEDRDGTDDYLYVYGMSGGRGCGLRCMRVGLKDENGVALENGPLQERVENLANYEYFNGYNQANEPEWIEYNEFYMAAEWNYSEKAEVLSAPCGEMSVCYNAYLGKYMATYQQHNALVMRLADHPYGPFGQAETILTAVDFNTFYNAFTSEIMLKDNGKTVYFFMSQWPRDSHRNTLDYFVGLMEMKLK